MHFDTKVEIVGILAGWRLVVQTIVGVVVPPFTININEFSLTFQEVSMMLGLPTNTVTIVSKGSIVWIPIGNDSTVASERTQVHDSNRSNRIES